MKIIFLSLFIAHFYSCSNHETETKAWIMSDKYKIYLDEPVDSVKWEIDNLQTAKISEMGVTYLSVMEPTVIWKGVSANPSIITAFDSSKRLKTFEIIYTLNTIDKKNEHHGFCSRKD